MCFRPASTTMGARICMKCHYVCDDVSAEKCPQCGEPFEAPRSRGADSRRNGRGSWRAECSPSAERASASGVGPRKNSSRRL